MGIIDGPFQIDRATLFEKSAEERALIMTELLSRLTTALGDVGQDLKVLVLLEMSAGYAVLHGIEREQFVAQAAQYYDHTIAEAELLSCGTEESGP